METTYIVGGGPSLKNFDWALLKNKNCIAVNLAFRKIPNAKAIYFSDVRFWLWYSSELLAHGSTLYTGAKSIPHPSVIKYRFSGLKGLDTRPNKLKHGKSSGYAAINLAYHLGAKKIILLGFDLNDCTHWHEEEYKIRSKEKSIPIMLENFPFLVEPLKREGVEIINANPSSAIECFKKANIHDVF